MKCKGKTKTSNHKTRQCKREAMIGNLCWIHINGKKVLVRVPESWNLKTRKEEQEENGTRNNFNKSK